VAGCRKVFKRLPPLNDIPNGRGGGIVLKRDTFKKPHFATGNINEIWLKY
jgi:hypothetical protein